MRDHELFNVGIRFKFEKNKGYKIKLFKVRIVSMIFPLGKCIHIILQGAVGSRSCQDANVAA